VAYWLKALGTSTDRMTRYWVRDSPEDLRNIGFPRNPSVRVGDPLVYYASGYGKVVGLVEVFMPPSLDNREAPWSYRCDVRPRIAIADIERGVELDELNVPGERDLRKSIRQQSHIRLSAEEYDRAFAALRAGLRPDSGGFIDPRLLRT
jgi:hypothetical protein